MRRSIFYAVPLILILAGLLGPAIYSNKYSKTVSPAATAGTTSPAGVNAADPSAGGSSTGGESGPAARPAPETGRERPAQTKGEDLVTGSPATVAEKDPALLPAGVPPDGTVTINIAVVGKNGELLFGPSGVKAPKGSSGNASPLGALDATGLTYDMSSRTPGLVEAIGGQRNKGQGGWMYKVNEEIPLIAAEKKKLSEGDRVIWWYSNAIDAPPPEWDALVK